MDNSNVPDQPDSEQTQPEPPAEQPPQAPVVPVPTSFRRNLWLLAIILGAVIIAWILSVLWKRVPEHMASLGPAAPPVSPPPSGRRELPAPGPAPVALSRVIGTDREVIIASPALSLEPGGLTYRLARLFDVTKRAPDFHIEQLIRLPGRWADQLPTFAADLPPEKAESPFRPAQDVALLQPQDRVLVLSTDTETRAYPVQSFASCAGVYDTIAGKRVFICWSALTQTARCLVARLDERNIEWRDAGLLYRATEVCYDREDGSLWDPFSSLALTGPDAGRTLASLPLAVWQWEQWKAQQPATPVLIAGLASAAAPATLAAGTESQRAQEVYLQGPFLPAGLLNFKPASSPIPPKTFVLGVTLQGKARAYPLDALLRSGTQVVKDSVAGQPVEVHVTSARTAYATSEGRLLDAPVTLWFAWQERYPEADLYQVAAPEAAKPATPEAAATAGQ